MSKNTHGRRLGASPKSQAGTGAKARFKAIATVGAVGLAILFGAVWWQSNAAKEVSISEVSHIHGIAVDRNNPQALLLATHYGLYRAEGGVAERISDNTDDYMGFSPHPTDPDTLYASGHPASGGNLGVIMSDDGGRTWRQIAKGAGGPVDFHGMDVSAADPNVMYGLYGQVQTSRDGGRSWEIAGAPPADTFALAASAIDPDTVYAATRSGVMVSQDAARSWRFAYPVEQPASMVEAAPGGTIYAFVVGKGLIKADESNLEWEIANNGFGDKVVLHLAVDPSSPDRLFAVTQDGQILQSSDGGRNWQPLTS